MQQPHVSIRVGKLSNPPTHFWVRLWVDGEFHSGATVRKEDVSEKAGQLFMQWALKEKQVWRGVFPAMLIDFHKLPTESVLNMIFRVSIEEELPEPQEVHLFDAYIFIQRGERADFMVQAHPLMSVPATCQIPVTKQMTVQAEKLFRDYWSHAPEYRLGDESKTLKFKDNITIIIPVYGLESLKDQ